MNGRVCTCAGTAPGYPQHEDYCGHPESDVCRCTRHVDHADCFSVCEEFGCTGPSDSVTPFGVYLPDGSLAGAYSDVGAAEVVASRLPAGSWVGPAAVVPDGDQQ